MTNPEVRSYGDFPKLTVDHVYEIRALAMNGLSEYARRIYTWPNKQGFSAFINPEPEDEIGAGSRIGWASFIQSQQKEGGGRLRASFRSSVLAHGKLADPRIEEFDIQWSGKEECKGLVTNTRIYHTELVVVPGIRPDEPDEAIIVAEPTRRIKSRPMDDNDLHYLDSRVIDCLAWCTREVS